MKKYAVKEPTSLKNFTDNTCASASFCFRTLLKSREIRVNGAKVSCDLMLDAGDEVCYFLTPSQESKTGYTVVYEDSNVIVTDKESGVNSEAVFQALSERGNAYFIHRLDRNTAGLLIFARTQEAEGALKAAFRNHRVEKIYHALVVGNPDPPRATLCDYLIKDDKTATVAILKNPAPNAEKIKTEYETLETRERTTLLKITLHTGKTHQIRAHMAFIKHPVVGDEKYGDNAFNKSVHASRQRLVAKELRFALFGSLSYLNEKTFVSERNVDLSD